MSSTGWESLLVSFTVVAAPVPRIACGTLQEFSKYILNERTTVLFFFFPIIISLLFSVVFPLMYPFQIIQFSFACFNSMWVESYYNCVFMVYFLLLNTCFLRRIHVAVGSCNSFIFPCCQVSPCVNIPQPIHPSNCWWTSGLCPVFGQSCMCVPAHMRVRVSGVHT